MEVKAEEFIQKHSLLECIQCGVCSGGCPVLSRTKLNVRRIMREIAISKNLTIPPEIELWSCTTCSACEIKCPKELSPVDAIIDLRSLVVEEGQIAPTLRDALESIYKNGNPWGNIKSKRSDWSKDLKLKNFSEGAEAEILYYVGCTASYDPRVQEVAKAMVKILNEAGVDFGILGNEEPCCGNEVRGMGEVGLFEELVENNLKLFDKYHIKKIITSSPHAYNAFKNLYGENPKYEVQHYTQFFAKLIEEGKLKFTKEVPKSIAYQDPCFLGRRNDIYDEPRKIIQSIPGVKFIELDRSRERSLCCEGGGGRMWIDIDVPTKRLSEVRIKEAVDAGAEILATSCPFCMLNLEDAVKTTGYEDSLKIMDIAEIASQAL